MVLSCFSIGIWDSLLLNRAKVCRFAFDNQKEQTRKPIRNLYCSSYTITKKVEDMPDDFQWKDSFKSVYKQTQYPKNTSHFTKK
jgi:hypothetical protein